MTSSAPPADDTPPDLAGVVGASGDERLDTAFGAGEPDALRRAYDRYGALVYGFCRRTLPAAAAEDATQETFVGAWRNRHRYDASRGSVGGWLMGIARFKVIEQLRREGRLPGPMPDSALDRPEHPTEIEAMADRMLLADALDQLPARTRTVVELAFYEELTHVEIAERCGLPLGTVKSDLRRGMERLRRHLRTEVGHE